MKIDFFGKKKCFISSQERNNVSEEKNSEEPMDKEEALKAYQGLSESKK